MRRRPDYLPVLVLATGGSADRRCNRALKTRSSPTTYHQRNSRKLLLFVLVGNKWDEEFLTT
jgi:hypothetical protein